MLSLAARGVEHQTTTYRPRTLSMWSRTRGAVLLNVADSDSESYKVPLAVFRSRRVFARHVVGRVRGKRTLADRVAVLSTHTKLVQYSSTHLQCSRSSLEGLCHHCAKLVHTPPPPTRKPRHRHLPNLPRVNKPFTISCRNTFNPPNCSYRTFLVRSTPHRSDIRF